MYGKNQAHQSLYLPIVPLINTSASGVIRGSTSFKVKTPDSRLRTKISILFGIQDGGTLDHVSAALPTLWLFEGEEDRSGVTGIVLPATDLVGTSGSPASIVTAGLAGYSREFVTAADWIGGVFTTGANGFSIGTWYLSVRYQPDSVSFSPAEWDELMAKTASMNNGGVISI